MIDVYLSDEALASLVDMVKESAALDTKDDTTTVEKANFGFVDKGEGSGLLVGQGIIRIHRPDGEIIKVGWTYYPNGRLVVEWKEAFDPSMTVPPFQASANTKTTTS